MMIRDLIYLLKAIKNLFIQSKVKFFVCLSSLATILISLHFLKLLNFAVALLSMLYFVAIIKAWIKRTRSNLIVKFQKRRFDDE